MTTVRLGGITVVLHLETRLVAPNPIAVLLITFALLASLDLKAPQN